MNIDTLINQSKTLKAQIEAYASEHGDIDGLLEDAASSIKDEIIPNLEVTAQRLGADLGTASGLSDASMAAWHNGRVL